MNNYDFKTGYVLIHSYKHKHDAESFHLRRLAFIWINDELFFNENPNDDRDHQHWVCEDFGITVEEFERLPRGYILPGRIQLFKGSSFSPINVRGIKKDHFRRIIIKHNKLYPGHDYEIYNGVKVGKVGAVWPPMFVVDRDWVDQPV